MDLGRNSRNSWSAVAARMRSTAPGNARTMHGRPISILLSEVFRCLCHSANRCSPFHLPFSGIFAVSPMKSQPKLRFSYPGWQKRRLPFSFYSTFVCHMIRQKTTEWHIAHRRHGKPMPLFPAGETEAKEFLWASCHCHKGRLGRAGIRPKL